MDSRVVNEPENLFESFLEIAAPVDDEIATVLKTYPEECDKDTLKQAPLFCYACKPEKGAVQHFTFVLTDGDGKYRFGFCRYPPDGQSCLCFISYRPWFEFFYSILDKVAELQLDGQGQLVVPLLSATMNSPLPPQGDRFMVIPEGLQSGQAFSFQTPDPQKLSTIPESINLTEYITNIDPLYILHLFAAMLFERRIIITSSKLSLVSACVHGAASLLYPLNWQHIFIPIMPARLVDYCCAPMPFLVGVHSSVMEKIRKMPLDEVVVLDADANQLEIYNDDLSIIPSDVVGPLKDTLKKHTSALDDTVAKAFLDAFVFLIGGYRDALRFREGEQIKFDAMAFIESRPKHMQPFLQKVLHLQQFQQFMMERLHRLNQGQGLRDMFENAITCSSQDSTNYLNKYSMWVKSKTRRGISEISSVAQSQVLPSMKTALSHLQSRTKKRVKGLKQLMNDEKGQNPTGMMIGEPQLASKTSVSVNDLLQQLPADSALRVQAQQQQQRPKRPRPTVRPYSEYRMQKTLSVSSDCSAFSTAPSACPLSADGGDTDVFSMDTEAGEDCVDGDVARQSEEWQVSVTGDGSQTSFQNPAADTPCYDLLGLSVASIPSRSHVTCLARELFLNFDPVAEDQRPAQPIPHGEEPSIGEPLSPTSAFDPYSSPAKGLQQRDTTTPSNSMYSTTSTGSTVVPTNSNRDSLDDFSQLALERSAPGSAAARPTLATLAQRGPPPEPPRRQASPKSLRISNGTRPPALSPRGRSFSNHQGSGVATVAASSVCADGAGKTRSPGPASGAPQFTPATGARPLSHSVDSSSVLLDSTATTRGSVDSPSTASRALATVPSSTSVVFDPLADSGMPSTSPTTSLCPKPGPPVKPYRRAGSIRSPNTPDNRRAALEFDPLR